MILMNSLSTELCPTLTNMLVIIVGGIPIAMPTVLSVTLALGAFKLARVGCCRKPSKLFECERCCAGYVAIPAL